MTRRPGREGAGALWAAEFVTPRAALPAFEEALDGFADAISTFDLAPDPNDPALAGQTWKVQLLSARRPDLRRLRALAAEIARGFDLPPPAVAARRLSEAELVAGGMRALPPVRAGRFVVRDPRARSGREPYASTLWIEPGLIYGTGQHESTRGCLLAIHALAGRRRFRRPLDLGCGTGVLALAMARTWRRPVVASDIDPAAVRAALVNARANQLAPWIRGVAAAGFAAPALRGRFDLIVANILARPLVRLAPDIRRALAPGGVLVLSGLLRRQELQVLAPFRALGFRLRRRFVVGDWPTLLLR